MLSSRTRYETSNASKYLQTLCKHFGNKVPVEFDTENGAVDLRSGPAKLHADGRGLDIRVSAPDIDGLRTAQRVIEDHLKRFAFREAPQPLIWSPTP
ncbi:DUF2218 domain-containing protein [Pseudooceanicola sp. MF1-13]|uniref:DUF2218 domain-containing protein n=1 Tax=Pseudooceanicola sp. MF1-13 TaxID=3379095 RepID=UPI003892769B